mgnify:CR=1 FL=1
MSNYIFQKKKDGSIIKGFKIIKDRIKITYLNGKIKTRKNTIEDENELLDIMNSQAFENIEHKDDINKEIRKRLNDLGTESLCLVGGIYLLATGAPLYIAGLTVMAALMFSYEFYLMYTLKKELNSILKYELLIDNDLFLNSSINKEKLKNSKFVAKKNLDMNKESIFDANTINSCTIRELTNLRNSVLKAYKIDIPHSKKKTIFEKKEK